MVEPGEMDTTTVEPAEQGAMVGQTEMEEEPESTMSVSLKELCQMVNVPYDQARALIESESSDGESVEREEATMEDTVMEDTVMEDTVVHADLSGGLEGEGPRCWLQSRCSLTRVVFNRGREEDSNAEEGAPPRKRLRAEKTWKKVINKKRRMVGKSYVGKQKQKEIMREPRAIGPRCSSAACAKSAKHHCSAIGTPERNNIFNEFWQHMTWEEKRMYVHGLIDVVPVQRRRGPLPPKKDQCNICCAFKTGNLPDDEWQHHLLQKEEARAEKLSDKNKASNNTMVLCMDLQALLLCPKLKASALYYKTKLAVHNFTVYNMLTHSATCYVWHEGEGSLSASEFASCIVNYLSAHTEPDTFILWSDGCGYQNRNAVLSNALLQFSMKKNKVVIQKYLEKGHTQMECDSVHSVIERRLRDQDVYLPAEYVNLMKKARVKPHPYEVKYIDHTFFQDFTKLRLCKSLRPGVRPGDPTVHDIRAIRYNNNGTMDFKINHSDDWHPHPSHQLRNSTSDSHTVTPLYSDRLKINELKFKHLQDLKEVIPKDFHSFYNNLLH
ncbi:uncharacterized protein LOC127182077 [Labeo rohita]|uniref:uncharacterized protein LOC127182077 n=1 Tax=Labeo rohita TaxID=84645 RepID=UPI0021E1CE69|nr:uncharacterized protein LOC127182077 [Labeo rohita]